MLHIKVEAIVLVDEGVGMLAPDCEVALSSFIFNYTCLPYGFPPYC